VARKRDAEQAVTVWTPSPFAGTVERVAASQGLSRSALVRRALVAYVLSPDGDDG
jgi:hypothetical protein